MSAITVTNLSKSFRLDAGHSTSLKSRIIHGAGEKKPARFLHALRDIDFEVPSGEFLGIVGRNGSGKSTLLKILAGIYQPTAGRVDVEGRLVPFIELGVGFNPELTGRQNVFLNGALLGMSRREVAEIYDDIVEFAELEAFMDQRLKNYSSGMQVRLAFSMATRANADVLLVDEVLAVGDAAFQRKCFQYFKELKAQKKTVVFVTHDMSAVREFCDRAILIDEHEIKLVGRPDDVAREYHLLFLDGNDRETYKQSSGDRWGTKAVEITAVETTIVGEHLVVDIDLKANGDVDELIYGLHVLGSDGVEITAANNRMLLVDDIRGIIAGERFSTRWTMLNVFNDGDYYLTLTYVAADGTTYDWFTKAHRFSVRRTERSTTAVLPPIELMVARHV
jgi:ABC-2 type transport system ATP-binding protein